MAKRVNKIERVDEGSGNVLVDLGLSDAAELTTKVQLAVAINQQIEARSLSQIAVAELLSINQPKVSALQNYKLDGFSVERLMTFLTGMGSDIEIRIRKPKRASNRAGRISVESASSIRNRKRRFDGHRIVIDRT
ncbi:MAG TPA: helix-turn-helix transcriptional regulator [Steroidobacteraceae bacterium]|jgi:predicted XRE-type DNA-binding protein|nr:helix-turn-helix transcriptional regulator [Steroidobacteraceae bacterium]